MSENEISIPMSMYFDRTTPPTLQEVVDSLQGFDAIVKRFPKILSELTDLPVTSVSVNVNKIEIGSLYDDLIVKLFFGDQNQMDLFIKNIHDRFMNHKSIPYLVFFALLIYGASSVCNSLFAGSDSDVHEENEISNVVNSNNNIVVNMISAEVGKDPEAVRAIIERAIPRSDSLKIAKESFKVFSAFADSSAIRFREFDGYRVPREFVGALPPVSSVEAIEDMKDFEKVEVQIRAADMDSMKTGWGAKIPAVCDRRIRVKVSASVDASKITIGSSVSADVTVVYKSDGEDMVPSYAMIRKIY